MTEISLVDINTPISRMVQPQELQPPGDMTPADLEVPLELTVKPRIVTAVGRPEEDDLDILRQKGEFVVYLARIAAT